MFYYFEGPDGAGKSTLAEKMATRIIHHGPYPDMSSEDLYLHYSASYYEAARSNWAVTAVDRGHWSEYVYGNVLRGSSRLSFSACNELDRLVDELGGLRVYVTASPATLATRCLSRGEDFTPQWARGQIVAAYDEVMKYAPCRIDTTRLNNDGQ